MQSQMRLIDDRRMALSSLDREMENLLSRLLERKKSLLLQNTAKLEALSPLAVMTRGYSALFDEEGHSLKSAKDLNVDEKIGIRLSDGKALAQILEVEK